MAEIIQRIHPPDVPFLGRVPGRSSRVPRMPSSTTPNTNPRFSMKHKLSIHQSMLFSPIEINGPISPEEAISKFPNLLSQFEKQEINCFPEVYFIGKPYRKIVANLKDANNYGYDDQDFHYKLISGDHLAYRFEIIYALGRGAFGEVCKCYDHKTKQYVAVKILVNTDLMRRQGRVEAQLLSRLNKHNAKNVVQAYDFFMFRGHICITYELLQQNLYQIIEMNNKRPLQMSTVKKYAKEMLMGIYCCHKLNVIHCDLKPENVLLDNDGSCKIIDFGSGCFIGKQMYSYIQSRFYRAPEVILGIRYNTPMDIWSFALIIIELITGKPLFPGHSELEMLYMISKVIGLPPKMLIASGKRKREFFDEKLELKPYIPKQGGTTLTKSLIPSTINVEENLSKILGSNDPLLIDFLIHCLTWDQNQRYTASDCLKHKWLSTTEMHLKRKKQKGLPDLY